MQLDDTYAIQNNRINYDIIIGEFGIMHSEYIYKAQTDDNINLDYCGEICGIYLDWFQNDYQRLFTFLTNISDTYDKESDDIKKKNIIYQIVYKLSDLYWLNKCLHRAIKHITTKYEKENIQNEKQNYFLHMNYTIEDLLYCLQSDTIIEGIIYNDKDKQFVLKQIHDIAMYIENDGKTN